MFLRILILFFVSLTLNAAEIVWDAENAAKIKKISQKEYNQALINFFITKTENLVQTVSISSHNEKDIQLVRFLTTSAKLGNAASQNSLGTMYIKGVFVNQDIKEAIRLISLSSNQGYAAAQNNLGLMYQKNLFFKQDYKESARLITLSSNQGYAPAQYNLAWLYGEGVGVKRDLKEANRLFNSSVNNGYAIAQYLLGVRYPRFNLLVQQPVILRTIPHSVFSYQVIL